MQWVFPWMQWVCGPLHLVRIAFYSFSFAISFLIAAALCMT